MIQISRLIFRNFWTVVALGGAVGEWILVCWAFGSPASWAVHAGALTALLVMNRLGAEAYHRERHTGPILHAVGGLALGMAVVSWIGALALGATAAGWWAMSTLTALPAQAGALTSAVGSPFGPPFDALAGLLVGVAMAVAAWGYTHGHRRIRVTHLDVPLAGLPPELDGLRIVHISDFHLGPTAHRDGLREAFDEVNALEPDLICVTGDVIDSERTDLDHWMPELARLRARHGVLAVLGNHDHYAGGDRVADALRAHTDWRLLRDEVATLEIDGARLHVIGLDDRRTSENAAMLRTLYPAVPAGEASFLLVHQPMAFPPAAKLGVRLTLAGHTHGGQIAVPGVPALNPARLLMTRFDAGTFESGGAVLHVNRGLGTSGQRVRVGAPREITLVTLFAPAALAA